MPLLTLLQVLKVQQKTPWQVKTQISSTALKTPAAATTATTASTALSSTMSTTTQMISTTAPVATKT